MKHFLLVIAFLAGSFFTNAQEVSITNSKLPSNNIWQTVMTDSGVEIQTKMAICPYSDDGNMQEMISWKLVNSNDSKVLVRFNKEIYFDGKCLNCTEGSTEDLSTFVLEPNAVIETNCKENASHNVFVKFTEWENKSAFTKLVLTQIQVNKF